MEWMRNLIEQVENTSEDHDLCDFETIEENEIVIGTLPVELRKFLTLMAQESKKLEKETDEHIKQHEDPEHGPMDCASFHEKHELSKKRIKDISSIFWNEVRDFVERESQLTKVSLGIREDWKVVQMEDQVMDFADIFKGLDSMIMEEL